MSITDTNQAFHLGEGAAGKADVGAAGLLVPEKMHVFSRRKAGGHVTLKSLVERLLFSPLTFSPRDCFLLDYKRRHKSDYR